MQSLLVLPMAYLVRRAFDTIVASRHLHTLLLEGLTLLVLQCASGALSLSARWISLEVTKQVVCDLRSALLAQAYLVCSPFAPAADRAWLHTAIVDDTERVDVMSNALLVVLLPAIVTGGLLTSILLALNLWLTLATASLLPLIVISNLLLGRMLRNHIEVFRRSFERFSQGILFALRAMDLTRARGAQDRERRRQLARAEHLRTTSRKMAWLATAYTVVQSTASSLCGLITLVVGGSAVALGRMSIGDLASFYFVLAMLSSSLNMLWSSIPQILTGAESLTNLYRLAKLDAQQVYAGTRKITVTGRLALESVSFGYPAARIFSNLTLALSPGAITAVVGSNGAGKTTMAYLMMGLLRPQGGRVCADGAAFDDLDVEHLRGQIGFVMEQPWIFAGSIRENIAYGRPDASEREVKEAAALAAADEFISRLAASYETLIGDGGVSLAGGQCQRIAIARALLGKPRLLILDEPTSHLDAQSISRLFANLRTLERRPAIFLITHDPALAALAHHAYELRGGSLHPIGRSPAAAGSAMSLAVPKGVGA